MRFEHFPERSSIAPLKVVSRNLLCGFCCYRVEAFTSTDPALSSSRIARFTRIPHTRYVVGSKHLNLSGNFSPSPLCGKFPRTFCGMLLQGGGVYIYGATVTFINTQIHDNQATFVRLARDLNLSRNVLPSPRCGKFPGTDM